VAGYIQRKFPAFEHGTVTHPSTKRARRRLTSLIETKALPLRQTTTSHGRRLDHGGTRGTSLPQNLEWGTLMQIVPSDFFCHIGTKRSILWPSKYAKICFWPALCPGPRCMGELTPLPRPPSRLEKGHPSPYPTPLGTDPPSALAICVPPEFQPDLRLCHLGLCKSGVIIR